MSTTMSSPPCLRRTEPSAPLCAPRGQQPLHYVSAQHTKERGLLATATGRMAEAEPEPNPEPAEASVVPLFAPRSRRP